MFVDATEKKVMQTLKVFFEIEQGNRVTMFNISGLVSKVERDFKESVYIEPEDKKKGK